LRFADLHEQTIRRLPQVVVNRIAAGEVIQRPVNAAKELIENALDAGATQIALAVVDGGLTLLRVSDNGHGIGAEDLDLLCERFATSKLWRCEDLRSVGTFGFRGEALASISHVARSLSVTSRRQFDKCGNRCIYKNGCPTHKGKCAAAMGTSLTVDNLFFSMPLRCRTMKRTASEQYRAILKVVSAYAIHYAERGVGVSCCRLSSANDIETKPNFKSTQEVIRDVYGTQVATDMVYFTCSTQVCVAKSSAQSATFSCSSNFDADMSREAILECYFSGLSQKNPAVSHMGNVTKKTHAAGSSSCFLLFVNNRLVENTALHRVVDDTCTPALSQGTRPFVYLAVVVSARRVDVNIHPTKREVRLLDESRIAQLFRHELKKRLQRGPCEKHDASSTVECNAMITRESPTISNWSGVVVANGGNSRQKTARPQLRRMHTEFLPASIPESTQCSTKLRNQECALAHVVRSNHLERQIDSFFCKRSISETESSVYSLPGAFAKADHRHELLGAVSIKRPDCRGMLSGRSPYTGLSTLRGSHCPYSSVERLLTQVHKYGDSHFQRRLKGSVFVGIINERWLIAQCQTMLIAYDHRLLLNDMFYQLVLQRFGRTPALYLDATCRLRLGEVLHAIIPNSNAACRACHLLLEKNDMLDEYFGIRFDNDGYLSKLPELLPGYAPYTTALPDLLYGLATRVDWSQELPCFGGVATELAHCYARLPMESHNSASYCPGVSESGQNRYCTADDILRLHLFPACKALLLPSKVCADVACIELSALDDLFRVFER